MIRLTANQLLVYFTLCFLMFTVPVLAQDATATPEAVLIDQAYISTVTVNDDLTVDISGELGDACTDLGDIEQVIDGTTITITIMTTRPADLMCAALLQVFETTITLDAAAITPGENLLVVNGTEYPVTLPEVILPTCDDLTPDEEQAKFENDQFCFLHPASYNVISNETLVLLTGTDADSAISLVIEILRVDDTITSLEELQIIVTDTYSEQELAFEDMRLGRLAAIVTDSITMRSGASRHLYTLWDEHLITLELQPLDDDTADAIDELWTMITETWVFIEN